MATFTGVTAATGSLTGTATVDTFTLSGKFAKYEVIHHGDVNEVVYFRTDGVAPVAAAADNRALLPTERLTVMASGDGTVDLDIVAATGTPRVTVEGVG